MKFDVITVGSGVVDAFMETALPEKDGHVMLPVGSKVVCDRLWFATGGGGTNTAVSFSKLGFKTGFLGRLGKDENARMIFRDLKKYGIKFLGEIGSEPTGYSVIVNSVKQNRTILTHKGANSKLNFEELNLRKLKTKWFYMSAMINESLKTQEKLAAWAVRKNIRVAYNPSSYLTRLGVGKIKKILKNVEVLILNKEEARHLIKRGEVSHGLRKFGPKVVCVTDGKKGSDICDGYHIYTAHPNKVKIAEKTGAGDAFASGFVSGLMLYDDVEHAIEIGSLIAEHVIQKPGAKNGLLTKAEVESKLKSKWKIRVTRKVC